MNKKLVFTAVIAMALVFTFTNDLSLMAAPEFFSPDGAGRTPTIPILPPIG